MKNLLPVLPVLIGLSMLHILATGDIGMSWLAVRALRLLASADSRASASDTISQLELELRLDQFIPLQISCNLFISVRT